VTRRLRYLHGKVGGGGVLWEIISEQALTVLIGSRSPLVCRGVVQEVRLPEDPAELSISKSHSILDLKAIPQAPHLFFEEPSIDPPQHGGRPILPPPAVLQKLRTPVRSAYRLQDFETAQSMYVPEGDLHLTFLVTPVQEDVLGQGLQQKTNPPSLQWKTFQNMYRGMRQKSLQVARTCGITDQFFQRRVFPTHPLEGPAALMWPIQWR